MTSDVVVALLRVNLAAALAIAAVMALRLPARRLFGAEIAYRLWAVPVLAAAGALLPATRVAEHVPAPLFAIPGTLAANLLLGGWLAGVAAVAVALWWAQARFQREARAGRAGPAVVGVVAPRIVMPADDGRYSEAERALVRAHEREHINRHDPQARAWMAALQCLAWFNPLIHLAAHLARLDQELACDAAVLRHRPRDRALYAKALLKTQLATAALPFGCYWPARGLHPLEVRIGLLRSAPARHDLLGACLVSAAAASACVVAWASHPPAPQRLPFAGELAWQQAARPEQHVSVMLVNWPARARR